MNSESLKTPMTAITVRLSLLLKRMLRHGMRLRGLQPVNATCLTRLMQGWRWTRRANLMILSTTRPMTGVNGSGIWLAIFRLSCSVLLKLEIYERKNMIKSLYQRVKPFPLMAPILFFFLELFILKKNISWLKGSNFLQTSILIESARVFAAASEDSDGGDSKDSIVIGGVAFRRRYSNVPRHSSGFDIFKRAVRDLFLKNKVFEFRRSF